MYNWKVILCIGRIKINFTVYWKHKIFFKGDIIIPDYLMLLNGVWGPYFLQKSEKYINLTYFFSLYSSPYLILNFGLLLCRTKSLHFIPSFLNTSTKVCLSVPTHSIISISFSVFPLFIADMSLLNLLLNTHNVVWRLLTIVLLPVIIFIPFSSNFLP